MSEIKMQEILTKIKNLEKDNKLDLSSDEDLSVAVMHLISIEEHLFFSYEKTDNQEFLNNINAIREMRKQMMEKLIKNKTGESWCLSKHLLGASMRLIEVGNKQLKTGTKKEAEELFKNAFDLYTLFWGLNLGIIETPKTNEEKPKTLKDIIKKIVDCCKE